MTTIKTLLAAAALTAVPAMSMAACGSHSKQVMSCGEGLVWSEAQQTCVQQVMS
ncbi:MULTISPECIES: chitin-binding domain-containing protein [unclassified Rhodosalinus]|uniref:chitin-binding domain-containing protein n=1 Tax=unclassified Rhodosalinus TaxID=2630183 RepID=UPI003526B058